MREGAIGIVGGVGPYAGLDLMRKIFDGTEASTDQEHLPIVHISFSHAIADRTLFLLGDKNGLIPNPGESIGRIMQTLAGAGATVIGMPCNTAHSPLIFDTACALLAVKAPNVRVVHMINAVIEHIRTSLPQARRIGVLSTVATFETRVYQDALDAAGFMTMAPDADGRIRVQAAIADKRFGIKAQSNPVTHEAKAALHAEALRLTEQGAEAVILGCTEIPLALTDAFVTSPAGRVPLVDATQVLATALVDAFAPEKHKKRI